MKKVSEDLSIGGPFRLDSVRKGRNGEWFFSAKMAVQERNGSKFGGYVDIETRDGGNGLYLTTAHSFDGILIQIVSDCFIPSNASFREAAWLFANAMLGSGFEPVYDQRNKIVAELCINEFTADGQYLVRMG